MLSKEIVVRETAGVPRLAEPVRLSVPFARGEFRDPARLALFNESGSPVPVQLQPLSRWSDGSLRWLLCDFAANAPAGKETRYRLLPADPPPFPRTVRVRRGPYAWEVDTGAALFTVDARRLAPFSSVRLADGTLRVKESTLLLTPVGKSPLPGRVEELSEECPGPFRSTLRLAGSFGGVARFTLRLTFYAGTSLCHSELTLLNPAASRHPGGMWDLGDPSSLFFRELALTLSFGADAEAVELSPGTGETVAVGAGSALVLVRQESSGGARRSSPNHLAAGGRLGCGKGGYFVACAGKTVQQGERALPLLFCRFGAGGVATFLPRFWQEFPKALEAGGSRMKASFFPEGMPEPYELQGGEQKTSALWLDAGGALAPEWLRAPLAAYPPPEVVAAAAVFPDLPAATPGADLVDEFLPSPQLLLARREAIDEYGWRHFGDIYADHEAVYHKGVEPFISHYNNQYDICAGLYRKWLASGEQLWGELALDLARHMLDIDIYHTDEDREEYNHGLFWHTDHYITAGLATHRSFSSVHLGEKDRRFFGGGPGAEHCYSTGLLLTWYLTGNPEFRDAVTNLADWCYRCLTGARTVMGAARVGLRYLTLLRRGKGRVFPEHPLTRGTGNAINASLDALAASGDGKYLARAEELIRGALHPEEEIAARDLRNPETAWSYTVLLAAAAKYLDVKRERGEIDGGYAFARGALLNYARWMVAHEYPYLQKPELLEYPNETWAAQELRKSVVLYHAARYAGLSERPVFLAKARELLGTAVSDLRRFPTSCCTRPVALMLQNGWVAAALGKDLGPELPAAPPCSFAPPPPRLHAASVARRVARELTAALRETTLKKELLWLRARLKS